jgi:hypothetical protein
MHARACRHARDLRPAPLARPTHPVSGLRPRKRLSSCAHPIMRQPQVDPKLQEGSRVKSARGMHSAFPRVASRMVPRERPPRPDRSEKLRAFLG